MAHNYPGLADILKRLGINEVNEVNAILRLSDYERKGTVQALFSESTKKASISVPPAEIFSKPKK